MRSSSSDRMSKLPNCTPSARRMLTARIENPHCGKSGVPFMKRNTRLSSSIWSMRCRVAASMGRLLAGAPLVGREGLELKRVDVGPHVVAQRLVDELVLLHAVLACERRGGDLGLEVRAVVRRIEHHRGAVGEPLLEDV